MPLIRVREVAVGWTLISKKLPDLVKPFYQVQLGKTLCGSGEGGSRSWWGKKEGLDSIVLELAHSDLKELIATFSGILSTGC